MRHFSLNFKRHLPDPCCSSLLKGFLFTQSGCHVNFARIHPNLLSQDSGRIRIARDNSIAVNVTIGVCTQGMIEDTQPTGPPRNQTPAHGISIASSNQEMRRFMAISGKTLGYLTITGSISQYGMSYYTRGLGKNGNFPTPGASVIHFHQCIHPFLHLSPRCFTYQRTHVFFNLKCCNAGPSSCCARLPYVPIL